MANRSSKTIVITGVTRGLGRALTDRFIERGHHILGCGRSKSDIEQLQRQYPTPNNFAVVDVRHDQEVRIWAERLLQTYPAPDFLLNNAAVINRNATLWETAADEFDQVIDVNVKGVASVLRYFVPAMIARKKGVIVNFSSAWGRSTSPEVGPYCASKYAIEGLTKALAQELPSGLAAIPLNPGIIDTAMLRSCFGDAAGSYVNADKWSHRAVELILQLSRKHNGQSLSV